MAAVLPHVAACSSFAVQSGRHPRLLQSSRPAAVLPGQGRQLAARRQAARPPCAVAAASSASAAAAWQPAQQPAPVQLAAAAAGALAAGLWQAAVQRLGAALRGAAERVQQAEPEEINAGIKQGVRQMRMLLAVAPLASVTGGSANTLFLVTKAVASFIKLYLLFLFLRVLLSWFPAFNWNQQPWLALRQVTDPYLNLFRGLVPPLLGSIDFTPLFGFLILQFLAGALDVGEDDDDF